MNRSKKNIVIFTIVGVVLIVGIIFLSLGVTIWRPKSTKEWLEVFQNSLNILNLENFEEYAKSQPMNIQKRIEIQENSQVIVLYEQNYSFDLRENSEVGYLKLLESYPSYENSDDNICDEYYLHNGKMSVRRENVGEEHISTFDSDKSTIETIIEENLGNTTYKFDESYFILENPKKLIEKENNEFIIRATIKNESFNAFLNNNINVAIFSNIWFEIHISKENYLLKKYVLKYTMEGKNYVLQTEVNSIDAIVKPKWV